MSHHARIEEVSDSDPEEMDPSDFDPGFLPNQSSQLSPTNFPASSSLPPQAQAQHLRAASAADAEKIKHWQCLYPIYFDKTRSKVGGRRVGYELAVENPLAKEILDAVELLGLRAQFEPGKMHPKDWSNPGRVKVLLKENGRLLNSRVRNKHHLFQLVAKHLQAQPTTEETALRLRFIGMPVSEKPIVKPEIPRGWKMPSILPLHSPALSGGGVSDNFMKDMIREVSAQQGQTDPGSGNESKKKDKKKKGKA
ncbi:MAG: signal recognition particle subunit [Cirrosporium novae-zelandiae]|nr:MAG: signal recognition particle subunit [Cirrosporium novae-zelandiae]